MSPGAARCLDALKHYCRGKDHCWPKQATLAKQMGCSLRSVKYYLEELRQIGACTSNQRPNTSCLYQLKVDFALPNSKVALPVALPLLRSSERNTIAASVAPHAKHIAEHFGEYAIGGKRADPALINRVASMITPEDLPAYRAAFKAFLKRANPESWGILVLLAQDVAAQRKPQGIAIPADTGAQAQSGRR